MMNCAKPSEKSLRSVAKKLAPASFDRRRDGTVLFDPRFRLIRETLPRRDRFFNDVKPLTQYLLFDSWEALMRFMLEDSAFRAPSIQASPKLSQPHRANPFRSAQIGEI